MKYIFFGTPDFAAIILEKLIKVGFIPEAVVCNPDRPVGRKKIVTSPPTKALAEKHNIKILQPETLVNYKLQIADYNPDLFIVAAYAQIIPKEILEIPRLGTIGVHPSFLPKYRGSSPIQTAILNGDEETGVSLYLIDEKMDHGTIIVQRTLVVQNLSFCELRGKLANLGADLLVETLPKFLDNEIKFVVQDEDKATYTKKFITEDGRVDLKDDPLLVERKIRALNPEPGVFTFIDGKRVKLLEAEIFDGKIIIIKTQIEGKKPVKNSIIL